MPVLTTKSGNLKLRTVIQRGAAAVQYFGVRTNAEWCTLHTYPTIQQAEAVAVELVSLFNIYDKETNDA